MSKKPSFALTAPPVAILLGGEWAGFEAHLVWAKAKFSPASAPGAGAVDPVTAKGQARRWRALANGSWRVVA